MIRSYLRALSRTMQARALSFTRRDRNPASLRLLQIAIYSWCLLHAVLLLPAAEEFWGVDAFISHSKPAGFFSFLDLLGFPEVAPYYPMFLAAQIALLVLKISGRGGRIAAAMIWFLTMNLSNRAWITLDGGNNLIHLLLFYLIFANPRLTQAKKSYWSSLDHISNNLSLLACRVQVVIVYLGAGLTKITGPLWQKGVALYYVLNTDEYTHPLAKSLAGYLPWAIVLATYLTLAFQLSFPWLIWNEKVRPWLVAIGTFLHLQISFVMGLFLFGLAMCASYVAFTPDQSARRKFEWLAHLPLVKRLEKMQTTRNDGRIFQSFSALGKIVAQLPLISIFYPFLKILDMVGIGDRVYRWVSNRREWRKSCRKGACESPMGVKGN